MNRLKNIRFRYFSNLSEWHVFCMYCSSTIYPCTPLPASPTLRGGVMLDWYTDTFNINFQFSIFNFQLFICPLTLTLSRRAREELRFQIFYNYFPFSIFHFQFIIYPHLPLHTPPSLPYVEGRSNVRLIYRHFQY